METKQTQLLVDKGGRVYLRDVRLSDVSEDYYNWMKDEEVTHFLEARFSKNSLEDIRSFVIEANNEPTSLLFAICAKEGDVHIGNIKLHRINKIHKFAEVSLMIGRKDYWGKGYGNEAISLVCDYAFSTLNLNKLTAECYANNVGSLKAFKKAGFKEEGLRKKQYLYKGNYVDAYMLGYVRPT